MKTQTSLLQINLKDIVVKPQVRTIFDDEPLVELAESIKEKGVIQPIALNEVKGKLYLICGERRFRASVKVCSQDKTRNKIPAVIYKDLSDEEVLQMQIIENLQRKDVHPMEEAIAYLRMNTENKFDIKTIAAKVGKTPVYIAGRLKLNSLISEFQKAFFDRKINLQQALSIAKIAEEGQKELWEDVKNDKEIEIDEWQINQFKSELKTAVFNTKDKTLNSMGACTNCPHNTASNTLLFPEEAKTPKCTLPSCFAEKTDIHFDRELKLAVSDPEVILVSFVYGPFSQSVKDIEKEHGKVYSRNECTEVSEPEQPEESDFDEEDYDNKKERDKAYNTAVQEYKSELKEYQEELESGKLKKAFIVDGGAKGKIVYVEINKNPIVNNSIKSTAKDFEEKSTSGKLSLSDIELEISRINNAELRKQEIENEKISKEVFNLLDGTSKYFMKSTPLSIIEKKALVVALHEKTYIYSFNNDDNTDLSEMFSEKFKFEDNGNDLSLITFLNKQSESKIDEMIHLLTRCFILYSLKSALPNFTKHDGSQAIMDIAHSYEKDAVNFIITTETASRAKRKEAVSKSLEKLNNQKKELSSKKK